MPEKLTYKTLMMLSEKDLRKMASKKKTRQKVINIMAHHGRLTGGKKTWKSQKSVPIKNEHFSEEYKKHTKSDAWEKFRKMAISSANARCEECGCRDRELHVHHLHYKTLGCETLADVKVLCKICHENHHEDKRRERALKMGRSGLR